MNESVKRPLGIETEFMLRSWRVEPDRNTISRNGEEKHLENRLMQTLVYLARNQGQAISRDQFFENVWQGLVVNEEALSRAISLLRAALDDDAHRPEFIQTIPGVGYRLIAEPVFARKQTEPADLSRPEKIVETGLSKTSSRFSSFRFVTVVVLALLLGSYAFITFVKSPDRNNTALKPGLEQSHDKGPLAPANDHSLAILPFVNMSPDPEQEFFADGMTEELLNMLAGVPNLRVTARTSSFFFKNKNLPISRIAEILNVKHILEGSVRRSGDRVRITAQLIDAHSDQHLWSRTYDRKLEDIFAIQDDVAAAIMDELTNSLDGLEAKPISRSDNLGAFEAYRTGRLLWWRRSVSELHQSIDLFKQAIEYDPGFAPAYAAIAGTRSRFSRGLRGAWSVAPDRWAEKGS